MTSSDGFGVLVHEPHSHAHFHQFHRLIAYGHATRVMITPEMVKSEPDIRRIPIEKRGCLFQDENPLELYRFEEFVFFGVVFRDF